MPRLQFSLRSVFLLTTIVAFLCWLGVNGSLFVLISAMIGPLGAFVLLFFVLPWFSAERDDECRELDAPGSRIAA